VTAVYSTFLQRAYDQVFQEICLQNVPVILALDRAGIVGADGPTHHGLYDLTYLRALPNIGIIAPRDENELRRAVLSSIDFNRPVAIRYPRGSGTGVPLEESPDPLEWGTGECLREGRDATIVAVGPLVYEALVAADNLSRDGIEVEVLDARFVKPLDTALILKSVRRTGTVITLEENAVAGGFGSAILELLSGYDVNLQNVDVMGIPDRWIPMGTQTELRSEIGLTAVEIERRIRLLLKTPEKKAPNKISHPMNDADSS
nr:transketolase C-terminal domain-containing protein [bacterium]